MEHRKKIRVLELYSGIGGMHCACIESGIPYEIVAAIDVNTTANRIYSHNFPGVNLKDFSIETLRAEQLDKMKIDMILMSPPCQPFTRVGKKQDSDDVRTTSFFHLLDLLPKLRHCPSYILVENVKGFETSETRNKLIQTLQMCNFNFQECMLTPLQFGIPNSRRRYYMIAKRKPLDFNFVTTEELMTTLPKCANTWMKYKHKACSTTQEAEPVDKNKSNEDITSPSDANENISNQLVNSDYDTYQSDSNNKSSNQSDSGYKNDSQSEFSSKVSNALDSSNEENTGILDSSSLTSDQKDVEEEKQTEVSKNKNCNICDVNCLQNYGSNMHQEISEEDAKGSICLPMKEFLEKLPEKELEKFLVPHKDLKRFPVMDIVFPCWTRSTCFTKRYGHFMEGAGSVVMTTDNIEYINDASLLKDEVTELKNREQWGEKEYKILNRLRLRYFTPREIANLLCFPSFYGFPKEMSKIQLYRCLGNSLNVHVVAVLIQLMGMDNK